MTAVCVVALGKIGLPLATAIASAGHRVVGADVDPDVVATVNRAREPFPGETGLADALAEVVGDGSLVATTDTAAAVAASDVVVVVVPLVVDERSQPDFAAMDAATAAIGAGLRPGALVSYETTLPVGTTRQRFGPALEAASGLTGGRDLFVVHSPERVFSGRIFSDLRRYPKLVGGVDAESTKRGVAFYESFLTFDDRPDLPQPNGVWAMANAEAAELAKLAETTYRDINIAFANELAIAAEPLSIDVHEVIDACNSQPFSHIHRPGIAVGGHCIPVYPHFLRTSVDGTHLPGLAREVNDAMPAWTVALLDESVGGLEGRTVAILGVAYRGNVKEHAFSGVFPTRDALEARGATVVVDDPLYDDAEIESLGLTPWRAGSPVDGVIVQADHDVYREAGASDYGDPAVTVDGRSVLDAARWPGLRRLGRP